MNGTPIWTTQQAMKLRQVESPGAFSSVYVDTIIIFIPVERLWPIVMLTRRQLAREQEGVWRIGTHMSYVYSCMIRRRQRLT